MYSPVTCKQNTIDHGGCDSTKIFLNFLRQLPCLVKVGSMVHKWPFCGLFLGRRGKESSEVLFLRSLILMKAIDLTTSNQCPLSDLLLCRYLPFSCYEPHVSFSLGTKETQIFSS